MGTPSPKRMIAYTRSTGRRRRASWGTTAAAPAYLDDDHERDTGGQEAEQRHGGHQQRAGSGSRPGAATGQLFARPRRIFGSATRGRPPSPSRDSASMNPA